MEPMTATLIRTILLIQFRLVVKLSYISVAALVASAVAVWTAAVGVGFLHTRVVTTV